MVKYVRTSYSIRIRCSVTVIDMYVYVMEYTLYTIRNISTHPTHNAYVYITYYTQCTNTHMCIRTYSYMHIRIAGSSGAIKDLFKLNPYEEQVTVESKTGVTEDSVGPGEFTQIGTFYLSPSLPPFLSSISLPPKFSFYIFVLFVHVRSSPIKAFA